MKTLIKEAQSVKLKDISEPTLKKRHVKIKMQAIGLCRTDLLVAQNVLSKDKHIVLGHEGSGIVVESDSKHFSINQKVIINPYFAEQGFMGLDFDGCIQEYVLVPESQVILNRNLAPNLAAYLEPVAASMAPHKIPELKSQYGAVWGDNRIAQLTFIILKNLGYNVDLLNLNTFNSLPNQYDYIIESVFDEQNLLAMSKALKPGATLIVKSRKMLPTPISTYNLLLKEIGFKFVNYYDFEKALLWLEQNQKLVTPLLGESFNVNNWQQAFDCASSSESKKIFITF